MKRVLTAPFAKMPAVSSSRYQNKGLLSSTASVDRMQQLQLMSANTTVQAVVGKTAESVSLVDWHLYRKKQDNRRNYGPAGDTRVEILPERHLASKLWAKPNNFYTRQEYVETGIQHLELTGEWYIIIEYSDVGHIPVAMWFARPDRMIPVPDPEKFMAGWIYRSPDGEQVPLELDQVIQIRVPNPIDPFRGHSPSVAAMPDIYANRSAVTYSNKYYENGAVPAGTINVPTELNDKQWDRLVLQWRERHQGINNAFRVGILENGMTFTTYDTSLKDQQYIEQRQLSRDVIREAWAFPKFMLGDSDDINRATAEAAKYVYSSETVMVRLERIKQALNNDYLPLFSGTGDNVEFDYDSPVSSDVERDAKELQLKTTAYTRLVRTGVDPEDAAAVVGLPPMKIKEVAYYGGGTGDATPDAESGGSSEPDEEAL